MSEICQEQCPFVMPLVDKFESYSISRRLTNENFEESCKVQEIFNIGALCINKTLELRKKTTSESEAEEIVAKQAKLAEVVNKFDGEMALSRRLRTSNDPILKSIIQTAETEIGMTCDNCEGPTRFLGRKICGSEVIPLHKKLVKGFSKG